jgi:hypothetical protein
VVRDTHTSRTHRVGVARAQGLFATIRHRNAWLDAGIEIGTNNLEEAYEVENDDDSSETETDSFDGDTFLDHLTCSLGLADGTYSQDMIEIDIV